MLRIDRLEVCYPARTVPALRDVSLSVGPGEVVAIAGPSGCGKSTVLAVLLGLVPYSSGSVTVDSIDLTDLDLDVWRTQVAWVPQRPHLFARSIVDNVRLGRPDATDREVASAISDAGLDQVVAALPEGLATMLGTDGAGLSAGERQRVALARAFLRDAPLLLLDEPTANLDGRDRGGRVVRRSPPDHRPHRRDGGPSSLPSGRERPCGPTGTARRSRGGVVTVSGAERGRADELAPVGKTLAIARPASRRVVMATLLGAGAIAADIGLLGTAAWLISKAAQHPNEATLAVAIVAVQFFGLSRGFLRYEERLVGHDAAFRLLADLRVRVYERLERLAPSGLPSFRRGDLLARVVQDVDSLQDLVLRVLPPFGIAAGGGSLDRRPAVVDAAGRRGDPCRVPCTGGHRRAVAHRAAGPAPRGAVRRRAW